MSRYVTRVPLVSVLLFILGFFILCADVLKNTKRLDALEGTAPVVTESQ